MLSTRHSASRTSRSVGVVASLALAGLVGASAAPAAQADSVRTAKPGEVRTIFPVLSTTKVSSDSPPAAVKAAVTGIKPKASAWRRIVPARPVERGGITGAWVGSVSGGICVGYRTIEGKSSAGCTTISIRTPSEPQLPYVAQFGMDQVDDATAPVGGVRGRDRFVALFPAGVSNVRLTQRGERDSAPLTVSRGGASAQAVRPWCIKYKIRGSEKTMGVGCGIVEATS